jgi:hypothetical protein
MSGTTIPIVMGPAGMIPATPADIQTTLIANVTATNPGYTANLPGTLIEDISSTDVAAILQCNAALVELINSVTPYGANQFLLNQLGQVYGVQQGIGSNTSVYVVFTGTPGFIVQIGFVVSDGSHQYIVQDGGIIGAGTQTGSISTISQAASAVVTTSASHGLSSGQQITISGALGMVGVNSFWTVTVISSNSFSIPYNSTSAPAYTGSGVFTSNGVSQSLFCVATQSGSWAVPAASVTALATSVPSGIALSVSNPLAGTPSTGAQTVSDYRSQVLQAGLAASMSMPRYLKTLLGNVTGVQNRLVSVLPYGTYWQIVVGGTADPYQIANAIFNSVYDITTLIGSQTGIITAISQASAAVVTTALPHGLTTGNSQTIAGVTGMTGANGAWTITVLSTTTFSIPYNSSSAPVYVSGGILTPNVRTQYITVIDYPNSYTFPFITPPIQNVTVSLTWNTNYPYTVSAATVASLGSVAIQSYINSIAVGQPINLFELQNAFQIATASILPTYSLTRMVFQVFINGNLVNPTSGTGIIAGDPESYFLAGTTSISITQG